MKGISKKACRKALEPVTAPSANCGLFLVDQIRYVIRTAVKNIGRRRMLVLCIYTKGDDPCGMPVLAYTMFQASNAFVTYDHGPLLKNRWRTFMLDNLEHRYDHKSLFAFYSKADEARVLDFCGRCETGCDSDDGYTALRRLQSDIRDEENRLRRRTRERNIHARMKNLRPLPSGLNDWIRCEALPAYFFYDYKKGVKSVKGVCSACGQEVEVSGARHNDSGVCPHCRRKFIMKSNAKRGRIADRITASVIQRVDRNEVVIRIVKAWSVWPKGEPQVLNVYENIRVFLSLREDGTQVSEAYHDSSESAGITPWKPGYPPNMYVYQINFNAETCGALFCRNLKRELAGTPWQFCPLQLFYEGTEIDMEVEPFLTGHLLHPRAEHLVKVGFLRLAADLVYRGNYSGDLDETQKRTHRILGVPAEDVPFLRGLNPDMELLRTFKEYCRRNLADRQPLLLWQLENSVKHDILPVLDYVTPHKMMRYLNGQYSAMMEKTGRNEDKHYQNMRDVLREYRDYLDMCKKERCDLRNSFVLFPADLQEAHDKTAERILLKTDAKKRRDFMEAYRRVTSRLDFTMEGMKIVYPASPEEIVAEGHALRHCVGSYVDRVANKECMILFLRRCGEESVPFYTLEVRSKKVTQARGMCNADATPEVKRFLDRWEKKVLRNALDEAEASQEIAA